MTATDSTSTQPPHDNLTLQQFVRSLQALAMADAETELELVELKAGDVLFQQGDEGESLYILIAGSLGVSIRQDNGSESEIDRLKPGDIVGEMAVISSQPRSATVYGLEDCNLLRLSLAAYQAWLAQQAETAVAPESDPAFGQDIDQQFDTRWRRIQLSRVFTNLLGDLDTAVLHRLQAEVTWLHLTNGDVLFRQGDAPDGMYVVINGRLRVMVANSDGDKRPVVEITAGETVGEYALITPENRSATVYAVRETNVVRVSTETFNKLAGMNPQFMTEITKIIVNRRQRAILSAPEKAPKQLSVALIPASPEIDIGTFAEQLAAGMARYGTSEFLDADRFDSRYGQPGAAQSEPGSTMHAAITAWLGEFENEFAYLLFVAEASPSSWTRRCIGNADRVLVIADPGADAAPGAAEKLAALATIPVRTELVLWHSPETERPLHTARWLDVRQIHTHHHVRQHDDAHMDRLVRRLTGNAIGLVLSGGAARGYAHMGVHRALEELAIPFDYIGGTSMGAVMGAAFMIADSNDDLIALSARFADPKMLFDRTLPITSFMKSRKVTNLMQSLYGDRQIEDLWIPFFCVASNITMAEPVIYQRGPLWRAVRASLAIPGVFAPVMADGDTLVDGGVMDNFPAKTLAQLCESEHIIGVNVAPFKEKKRQYDFDTSISGWRILLSRLNPFVRAKRAPSLIGVLLRTLEINSVRRAREDEALVDLMIYPESRGVGMLDFHKYESISRNGYEAALEPLRAWRDSRLITAE